MLGREGRAVMAGLQPFQRHEPKGTPTMNRPKCGMCELDIDPPGPGYKAVTYTCRICGNEYTGWTSGLPDPPGSTRAEFAARTDEVLKETTAILEGRKTPEPQPKPAPMWAARLVFGAFIAAAAGLWFTTSDVWLLGPLAFLFMGCQRLMKRDFIDVLDPSCK
jgi:hypothetical protein